METNFWAKTTRDAQPGVSVHDHCLHIGCVAEALIASLPEAVRGLVPSGAVSLAALHDIGKISCGFQVKCPAWLAQEGLTEAALRERWAQPQHAESDHAKLSQFYLQGVLKTAGTALWAVAAGVHHGRIFGKSLNNPPTIPARRQWEDQARLDLLGKLTHTFGPLPVQPPDKDRAALWCVAGLITVADWLGSNEAFFPGDHGLSLDAARRAAADALHLIHWESGKLQERTFSGLFGLDAPKPLQKTLWDHADRPGLFIVEGPMGCGKTEAALWAAHRLIVSGANDGLYFALPTQVTSNRIHRRVGHFLREALADAAVFRLAHGASWLEDDQTVELQPAAGNDPEAREHMREGRSWFASAKHALLARFGVGTIDQALQGVVAVKHFFVRRFGLAGKVVVLDEVHSYDVYTGALVTCLIRELLALRCSVIVLSATLTQARRRELMEAAGSSLGEAGSDAYPLVTVPRRGEAVREFSVASAPPRRLRLKAAAFAAEEILEECVERAEGGQHVLYLRNTVVEAQATFHALAGLLRAERVRTGLLHSRFPYFRRQELETEWLDRLGKERPVDGQGSLLVATQVVEQSVDIDLDFIVTDLAPTDMLLQRMGRLWRHERIDRRASEPEFWINVPRLELDTDARGLKAALGKSGRVYAPYVLLRTAEVFTGQESICLPDAIRTILEDTYRERPEAEEPAAWRELHAALEAERAEQAALAQSATKIFARPPEDDLEGKLTRLRGAPTRDVILLRDCEPISRSRWRLTPLEGEALEVSGYAWSLEAARLLARHGVRAPLYTVPRQQTPPWLSLHAHPGAAWALVQGEACIFPEAENDSALAYSPVMGLYVRLDRPVPRDHKFEDDDEFDC